MPRLATQTLVSLCALALAGCNDMNGGASSAGSMSSRPKASATLMAGDGSARGTASAVETGEGVQLTVNLQGFAPGIHGVHVHTIGACTGPDFTSAGGHWNPMMKQHGMANPMGMHMGDLPNATIGADGKGKLTFLIPHASIASGPEALLDADGAAIVVHAGPDDMKTDPSGNSGGRIACGVFKAG